MAHDGHAKLLDFRAPGVVESAVIGLPHADFGEAVTAVIAGAGDEADVIGACRQRLAAFKTPKRVIFVEDLPRNSMGKILKQQLRADVIAGRAP